VHGLRMVSPGGREAVAVEMRRTGFVEDMVADWLDAFNAISAEVGIGQGSLGYFGLSMGTFFGLPLLASELEFSTAVIGLAGTTKAGKPIASQLLAAAQAVTHPVLFLMQLEDELFPRDGYLELFDALSAEDKRLHANPGLHPEVPAEEIAHSFDFLCAHLAGVVERRIVNPLAE
jgi:dienelactone hydrolase